VEARDGSLLGARIAEDGSGDSLLQNRYLKNSGKHY